MKKVILIVSLIFFIVSCNIEDKKVAKQGNQIKENNIENKVDKKIVNINKNSQKNKNELKFSKEFIDIKKYSKEDQPAIELINNSIFIKKLQENQEGELRIIKTYNYFEPKQKKNLTRVVYAKDNKNYYYFCMDWPGCDETFDKYPIKEGKLEIIDKHNYKIGNKKYLNKYEEDFKKMQEDRLQNQVIIKDYGDGLVLKQNTKGFMYDELGQTILYLNGKELISLANNLSTIYCDGKSLNVCKGEKITDKFIRKKVAEKFEIIGNSKDVFIDKKSNIKVLYIWQYEGHDRYFIDLKNEKIIKDESGIDYFVKKVIQGKSGTFILGKGGKACGGSFIFINNEGKIDYLFKNNCDEDLDKTFQEIIDFELLLNKKVKIFYKSHSGKFKEKIIKLK